MVTIADKAFSELIPAHELARMVREMGQRIDTDYAGLDPLFIAVLNGAFVFSADLLRALSIPCQITFVKVASYAHTQSTGKVQELIGLDTPIADRHIIIVEDIVDSGLTVTELLKTIAARRPASVAVATLLHKPAATQHSLALRYVGQEIENHFVLGYGMDYDGWGRNLPAIYQLSPQ
jgi:hypoxanthine phosphoribosyltransferase